MSGDQLDLDALDAAYALGGRPTLSEGIALVAEVRRLREEVVRARHPVSLGPVPSPDYTMRVGWSHEPLPDRNTRGLVVDCL